MEIRALGVASVLAGQFGFCYASSDGDLIEGIIPEPDSISVTSVVREPFHPDFEKHCAGLTAGKTPACLKITRVREADGVSWVTQTTVNPLFTEEACRRASTETPSGREHLFHQD